MRRLAITPALMLVACGPDLVSGGEGSEDELADGRTLVQVIEPYGRARRIDLILVIDDSPSMRPFTERWAVNLAAFADVLEAQDVAADVRVAVTTTSVPGPTCAGARAHGGEPMLDSCRAHLEDFVGADEHGELGGSVEDLAAICEAHCSVDAIPIIPSPGRDDHDLDALAVRPWIEAPGNPFGGNLDGIELAEALTCAGLQGFAGCAFESPIEAAARMVEHMADPNHPMFEFRRPDAALSIVTIGDEDDCSHPASSATIFDPDGERIFWSDPQAAEPTSAVCINAGLECDGQSCALTDHALDGSPTDDPTQAVLTPTRRLEDALAAAGEFDKPPFVPVVSSIGGYTPNGEVFYSPPGPDLDDEEQLYLDGFGVLPGCQASAPDPTSSLRAGPGGRLAEIVTFDSLYSICDSDWSTALEVFFPSIPQPIKPNCIEFECVADCVLEEVDYADARTAVPSCMRDESGWLIEDYNFVVPDGADSCWVWQTDASGLTSDPADDMSDECVDAGRPGEIKIARRPGHPLPYDSVYELRCRPC
ncbi:MAG TPA: hypothetical protein VM869_15630 [Enhygromyxa sp.]|nr:hypothetical protein [Enhygromyxa sp.]